MAKLVGLKNIAIDLDNTILEIDWDRYESEGLEYFGDPKPGATEALKRLRSNGYRIVIHTARMNIDLDPGYTIGCLKQMIEDALNERDVPFDEIWTGEGKPIAPFYIDDRAIEFKDNWEEITERILSFTGLKESQNEG